jgi:DNA-binding beta-propeller fold protein YncE
MRSHAKPPCAGSTEGSGNSRGLFRRALASRGASRGFNGIGAPSIARPALFLCLLIASLLAIFAPAAVAAVEATQSYGPAGNFGGAGTGNGQFTGPTDIAVEPGTGNVLVADSGNGRVQVFAPAGGAATFLTSFGPGTLTTPFGIAIDQATGAIYVSDAGAEEIFRFTSDGAATPTYTQDVSFASPAQGAATGQIGSFASAIAVDPSSHDLLVADSGNKRVERFSAAGAVVPSFNGPVSISGSLSGPRDIAVSAGGTLYVVDTEGPIAETGSSSHVRVYGPTGTAEGELAGITTPAAVAVDPGTGRILVAGDSNYAVNPRRLYVFESNGTYVLTANLAVDPTPLEYAAQVSGLAVTPSSKAYVLTDYTFGYSGTVGVQTLVPAPIPGVELGEVSSIVARGAHVVATAAAGGFETTVRFETSLNGGQWIPDPDQTVISGTGEETVEADLTGLLPHNTYSIRVRAANDYLFNTSAAGSFQTGDAPPVVSDQSAGNITPTGATLNGTVSPNGPQTSYHFDYGETIEYGQRYPAGFDDTAGAGGGRHAASAVVEGLKPSTTYHYRLVAVNALGTAYGEDATFTTEPAGADICPNDAIREREQVLFLPECRAYEQVSPVDNGGVSVETYYGVTFARDDGNAIAYTTERLAYPQAESNPGIARFLSTRSATGWMLSPVDPPADSRTPQSIFFNGTVVFSKDLSRALVTTRAKLTPDAIEGGSREEGNVYIREIGTNHYTLVVAGRGLARTNGPQEFLAASDDLRTVSLSGGQVWREGSGLEEVPGKDFFAKQARDTYAVSADGSRVYTSEFGNGGPIYLTENGQSKPISVSHRAGSFGDPVRAIFAAASPDGRYADFEVSGQPGLTPDAPDGGSNAYRYDAENDTLSFLTSGLRSNGGIIVARPAADILYYTDGSSIRYLHEGVSHVIGPAANLFAQELGLASANGKYFAFEDLLYSAETDTVSCPSCRTDGGPSLGASRIGIPAGDAIGHHNPTAVLDDGTLFFDTPNPLVAGDSNGTRDVYSYNHGRISLLSGGKRAFESTFVDATPSGSDVFFSTIAPLVGQDKDTVRDLYDARVNGGLASQNPDPAVECLRDDCKATPNAGPELPFGGSEGLTGPGNVMFGVKKRCGKGQHKVTARGKVRCVKQHKK